MRKLILLGSVIDQIIFYIIEQMLIKTIAIMCTQGENVSTTFTKCALHSEIFIYWYFLIASVCKKLQTFRPVKTSTFSSGKLP